MKNMKRAMTVGFLAMIATPLVLLADDSGGGDTPVPLPCWTAVWQNIVCQGTTCSSGMTWCRCPGRIRCAPSTTGNKTLGTPTNAAVTCEDWIGTTATAGTCTTTTICSAGALAVPQSGTCITTVSVQACLGTCP